MLDEKAEILQAGLQPGRRLFPGGVVALALEPSPGAWLYTLMNYDFLVLYAVPPQSLAAYRSALVGTSRKDSAKEEALEKAPSLRPGGPGWANRERRLSSLTTPTPL